MDFDRELMESRKYGESKSQSSHSFFQGGCN